MPCIAETRAPYCTLVRVREGEHKREAERTKELHKENKCTRAS
jgi:hypothetical protein